MREFHEQLLITQVPIHYVSARPLIHEQSPCSTLSTKQSPRPPLSTSNILLIQHSPPQSFFILQLKHSPPSLTFSTSNIVLLPTFSFSNILLVEHSHRATFYSSNILLILKHSLPRMFSFANIWIRRKLISV